MNVDDKRKVLKVSQAISTIFCEEYDLMFFTQFAECIPLLSFDYMPNLKLFG